MSTNILEQPDDYEEIESAIMEIRVAKTKLQKQLRVLQTREWELVDRQAKRRSVNRPSELNSSEVSVERTMNQSDWISMKRSMRGESYRGEYE